MAVARPTYTGLPATVNFNSVFTLTVTLPAGVTSVSGSLLHTLLDH